MNRRIVVATAETGLAQGGDRLLQLVTWMLRQGYDVEIIALGEGWDLERFRSTAPTTVVDEFRRRSIARPADVLGLDRVTAGIKAVRLRRWLRRRSDAAFFIHHPLAASLLRYASGIQLDVVAGLPDDSFVLDDLRPEDLESLAAARAWIVASDDQRAAVSDRFGRPTKVLGNEVDPLSFPAVAHPDPGRGVVALVGPPDPWTVPDHGIEVAMLLHRARPEVRIRWLVADRRAEWLALHDRAHAGLTEEVEVGILDSPGALAGLGAIVRTSSAPASDVELVACLLAGLPVLDLAVPAAEGAEALGALQVEAVVARLVEFVDDPALATASAIASIDRLPLESFEQMASGILRLIEDK